MNCLIKLSCQHPIKTPALVAGVGPRHKNCVGIIVFGIVKKTYPNKRILIAHPPKRKSAELCKIADSWFSISRQKLRQNQLPEIVTTPHGGKLTRPPIWE